MVQDICNSLMLRTTVLKIDPKGQPWTILKISMQDTKTTFGMLETRFFKIWINVEPPKKLKNPRKFSTLFSFTLGTLESLIINRISIWRRVFIITYQGLHFLYFTFFSQTTGSMKKMAPNLRNPEFRPGRMVFSRIFFKEKMCAAIKWWAIKLCIGTIWCQNFRVIV